MNENTHTKKRERKRRTNVKLSKNEGGGGGGKTFTRPYYPKPVKIHVALPSHYHYYSCYISLTKIITTVNSRPVMNWCHVPNQNFEPYLRVNGTEMFPRCRVSVCVVSTRRQQFLSSLSHSPFHLHEGWMWKWHRGSPLTIHLTVT